MYNAYGQLSISKEHSSKHLYVHNYIAKLHIFPIAPRDKEEQQETNRTAYAYYHPIGLRTFKLFSA